MKTMNSLALLSNSEHQRKKKKKSSHGRRSRKEHVKESDSMRKMRKQIAHLSKMCKALTEKNQKGSKHSLKKRNDGNLSSSTLILGTNDEEEFGFDSLARKRLSDNILGGYCQIKCASIASVRFYYHICYLFLICKLTALYLIYLSFYHQD